MEVYTAIHFYTEATGGFDKAKKWTNHFLSNMKKTSKVLWCFETSWSFFSTPTLTERESHKTERNSFTSEMLTQFSQTENKELRHILLKNSHDQQSHNKPLWNDMEREISQT